MNNATLKRIFSKESQKIGFLRKPRLSILFNFILSVKNQTIKTKKKIKIIVLYFSTIVPTFGPTTQPTFSYQMPPLAQPFGDFHHHQVTPGQASWMNPYATPDKWLTSGPPNITVPPHVATLPSLPPNKPHPKIKVSTTQNKKVSHKLIITMMSKNVIFECGNWKLTSTIDYVVKNHTLKDSIKIDVLLRKFSQDQCIMFIILSEVRWNFAWAYLTADF